jgi:hypothetical protein
VIALFKSALQAFTRFIPGSMGFTHRWDKSALQAFL